jgi:uncharacterized membrane-anchored protein
MALTMMIMTMKMIKVIAANYSLVSSRQVRAYWCRYLAIKINGIIIGSLVLTHVTSHCMCVSLSFNALINIAATQGIQTQSSSYNGDLRDIC